ncbi:flagellar export chaperone FlgN [Peribacillus frigoritolerans]|uniref:flagellar export chaperone FlgN n=1 Tax=Peribacillus frigoritolerans TaxID=450367 RepID=UPI0032B371C6
MSARNIIGSLGKLVKLHKSFNQLAVRKTAILKANDTEAITALLISEQKHIKAINKTDKERQRAVEEFLATNGTAGQPEQQLGRAVLLLNQQVDHLLKLQKQEIERDIQEINKKKKSSNKYTNPYESLSVDGMFYDKRY